MNTDRRFRLPMARSMIRLNHSEARIECKKSRSTHMLPGVWKQTMKEPEEKSTD